MLPIRSHAPVRSLSPLRWAALLAAALLLGGCRQFDEHRAELVTLHAAGRYDQAAALLDDPQVRELYGSKNQVLWELERGAAALAADRPDEAIELLESAERTIEVQRQKSLGDVLGQWTINDRAAKYIAEPYEDMYVNVLKLLAQLEAGRLQGGATVEARRLASKADLLRDTYVKYERAIEDEGLGLSGRARSGGLAAVNKGLEFIESPLGTYLTAITFMETGEREFQRVAARRLVDSIELQSGLIGPVRAEDFEHLADITPEQVDVLVVALSGRGPTKYAERYGPVPLGTLPVYFELPRLKTFPTFVEGARLEIDGGPSLPLSLVEDFSAVALENHRRMLPLIEARTLARYALKAGIAVVGTEMARRSVSDEDQLLVQVAGVLAGLAALAATEKADIRAWTMLPGEARVGHLDLPEGEYRMRVVYTGSGGRPVYTGQWQTVSVGERGLTTIVTHYPG